jgi:hypothetical protein
MSQSIIRKLFETRLKSWADARSPALPVAWQNAPLKGNPTSYLRAFILPAPTGSDDLEGVHRLYTGIFQVSVVVPVDSGSGSAEGIADEIAALFPNNLALSDTGFSVQIITPMSIGNPIPGEIHYTVPVFAQYRADTI